VDRVVVKFLSYCTNSGSSLEKELKFPKQASLVRTTNWLCGLKHGDCEVCFGKSTKRLRSLKERKKQVEAYVLFSMPRFFGGLVGVSLSLEGAQTLALEHAAGNGPAPQHAKEENQRVVNWVPLPREKANVPDMINMWGWVGEDEGVWEAFVVNEDGKRAGCYWIRKMKLSDAEVSI
jgi:hypothetical protein